MARVTTDALKWAPAAANAATVTPSGTAWHNSAYVQLIASTANAIALAYIAVTVGAGTEEFAIDIAVGPANQEVPIATIRGQADSADTGTGNTYRLPLAVDNIPSGSRVAARIRKSGAATTVYGFAIGYYDTIDSDDVLAYDSIELPIAANGASITPAGTSWGNSSWVELIDTSLDRDILLGSITRNVSNTADANTNTEYEIDIGTGSAGAEAVVTTIKGNVESGIGHQIMYLPIPLKISAGTRIAVRLRKNNTSTAATWAIGATAIFYTGMASKVAIDTVASGRTSTGTTTFSITIASQSNRALYVLVSAQDSNRPNMVISSVTAGATSLTNIRSDLAAGNNRTELWYTVGLAAGTYTITITATGTVGELAGAAIALYNVDQSTPHEGNAGNVTTSTAPAISVTPTNVGSLGLAVISCEGAVGGWGRQTSFASLTDQSFENMRAGFTPNMLQGGTARNLIFANASNQSLAMSALVVRPAGTGTNYTSTLTETMTLTDTILKGPAKVLSETLTLTASLIKQGLKVLLETLTNTDTVLKQGKKTFVENTTWTDSLFRQGQKVLAETITFTDSLIRNSFKVLSETLNLTDVIQKYRPLSAFVETITLSDTVLKTPGKVLAESITLTDSLIRTTVKVLTETITFIDTVLKSLARILTDSITFTDIVERTFVKTFTEVITFTDTVLKQGQKLLLETLTLTATVLKQGQKTLVETITLTATVLKQGQKILSETITLTDTITSKIVAKILTETLNLTDSILKQGQKVLLQTITFTDTILKSLTRTFTETLNLTDTISKLFPRTLNETISLTDSLIRQANKNLTEIITFTATLLKQTYRTLNEILTFIDTVLKQPSRILSEVLTLSDSLIKMPKKVLQETLTLTDSIIRQTSRVFSETITLIDSVFAGNNRTFSEVLVLTDSIIKKPGKVLFEGITFTASLLKQGYKVLSEVIIFTDTFTRTLVKVFVETLTLTATLEMVFSGILSGASRILKAGISFLQRTPLGATGTRKPEGGLAPKKIEGGILEESPEGETDGDKPELR